MRNALVFLAVVVLLSGCVGKKETPKPKEYITPCNVIGEDILLQAEGTSLSSDIIKKPLAEAFVDDVVSGQTSDAWNSYALECWWGKNVGEQKDFYYCGGSYRSPEVDSENVITRYVLKEFKVGFSVEEHSITSKAAEGNVKHNYFLTVRGVSSMCSVA